MMAVKESMKRRAGALAGVRIIAGRASRPARANAGGGTISSVSRIDC
jgi:hypothetical protein